MSLPATTVKRLLMLSALGYLVFTLGVVGAAAWWQDRTSDRIYAAQVEFERGQVEACERGNVIRRQLAEDNLAAIETTRDLLAGEGLSRDQRDTYRLSLERRLDRRGQLGEYPCHTLRVLGTRQEGD